MLLISAYGWAYTALAGLELGVLITYAAQRSWRSDALCVTLLLLAGAAYDSAILGWGAFIGEGDLLLRLSYPRFLVHWVLVPFILVISARLADNAGLIVAASGRLVMQAAYLASIFIAMVNVAQGLMPPIGLDLEPVRFLGTLRYVGFGEPPPFAIILVNFFAICVFASMWKRRGEFLPALGGVACFLGNAVPASIAGPLPGSVGEALFLLGMLSSKHFFRHGGAADEEAPLLP
eukprot:scaffold1023_cov313-Pinguiococcus_pyrenoidosus.AAC.19